MNNQRKIWTRAGAIALALAVWQAAAMAVNMEMFLASPLQVLQRLGVIWRTPGFSGTLLFSALRVMGGFLCAFILGTALGILAGRAPWLETLLWPYVVTIKTVPVASFIILCLVWFSFTKLTILISFLIAFPVIYTNVLQGMKSMDPEMLEMARVYRVPWRRQLYYLYLPGLMPFLTSASGVSVGMAWKAGVAAEVIGIVNGSIGEKLYESKIYFENADLLSWTIMIILLSVAGEKIFVWLLKAAFRRLVRR